MKHKLSLWALVLLLIAGCGAPDREEVNASPDLLGAQPIAEEPSSSDGSPLLLETSSLESPEDEQSVSSEEVCLPSLQNLLSTALMPLGETAYVWGGGWNEEDTAAGPEATTIGVSPRWAEFADSLSKDYNHKEYRYQIHDGLDCSGYVGWVAYNVFESENGKEGYVLSSSEMAKTFASYGWGEYLPKGEVTDWKPGDVASMSSHVWICLGTCEDGSVLLIHSSPPGVRICGTKLKGKTSEAVALAKSLMELHYPEWYARFPECEVSADYLKADQMRWNQETFFDAPAIQAMSASEIAALLFPD